MDLAKVSKAIAGAVATVLVGWLAKHGVTGDELAPAIEVILAAVIGFVVVYLSPKNQE